MLRFPPLLALALPLLAGPSTTVAAEGDATPSPAPNQDPPLLVQSHQAFVRLGPGRVSGSTSWTVAILDPERAQGANAPEALEGAEAAGARIRFGELRLPDDLAPGTVLSFSAPLPSESGVFSPSGVFRAAPGHPISRAELVIRAAGSPLAVSADPAARVAWTDARRSELKVTWSDLGVDEIAEAVWSGGASWIAEGELLQRDVEQRLTTEIGRELSRDLAGMTPTAAAEAVFRAIRLVPGPDRGWQGRPARRVILEGSGTRAERGLVLLSVLRAAGYEPIPALYRPASLPGGVPTGLPAPALLPRPVVYVPLGETSVWIDPGADWVKIPALPAELTGAMAWLPGDLPQRIEPVGSADGLVQISGEVRLDQRGPASFTAIMTGEGAALPMLRERFGSIEASARDAWLLDLLRAAWPDLQRVSVTATGLGSRDQPVSITVRGQIPRPTRAITPALVGAQIPALLAPALAAQLPARISIREEIAVQPPPGLRLLAVTNAPRTTHPAAIVTRSSRREAGRVVLTTDVERPEHHPAASEVARAEQTLQEATREGPELLYLSDATPATARQVRSSERPAVDRAALEAMILWQAGRYRPARKVLARYVAPLGVPELDRTFLHYGAPYELRRELADVPRTEADQLATVPLLVQMGRTEEAWIRAAAIAPTQDHELRVRARLLLVELQPAERPDPTQDPDAAARWRDPLELLQEADASAARLPGGGPDPRVQVAKARLFLSSGQIEAALALLRAAAERSDDPQVSVLLAEASARAGTPLDAVNASLQQAIARASGDPDIHAQVAEVLLGMNAPETALRHALTAARLRPRDAQAWGRVRRAALAAGRLPLAVFAAERASSLALTDTRAASGLTFLATLAGRTDLATLGWSRGGESLAVSGESTAAELIGIVEPEHLLAVLRHHDAEVIADPGLLALRAELELSSGDRERAVRDGVLLLERHEIARGTVVAFGASLGTVWSSTAEAMLDRQADRDLAVRAARVELRALLGGSLAADLRRMTGDPRARIWSLALSDAKALAAEDPNFTPGLPPHDQAPRGFSPNPLLGAVRGVRAWSAPLTQQAIVRHTGPAPLPPPLSLLYTVEEPALSALPGGGRLVRLSGGTLPLFAAIRTAAGETVLGLGHSPAAAVGALAAVPPT